MEEDRELLPCYEGYVLFDMGLDGRTQSYTFGVMQYMIYVRGAIIIIVITIVIIIIIVIVVIIISIIIRMGPS